MWSWWVPQAVAPVLLPDAESAQDEASKPEPTTEAEISSETVPDAKDEDAEAFMRTFHEVESSEGARTPRSRRIPNQVIIWSVTSGERRAVLGLEPHGGLLCQQGLHEDAAGHLHAGRHPSCLNRRDPPVSAMVS